MWVKVQVLVALVVVHCVLGLKRLVLAQLAVPGLGAGLGVVGLPGCEVLGVQA